MAKKEKIAPVHEAWPFAFAGLSIPHAAALGAFLSRLNLKSGFLDYVCFFGFLGTITLFTFYLSYTAYVVHDFRGEYYRPVIGCSILLVVAFFLAGIVARNGYFDHNLLLSFITLVSWATWSIVSAMFLRDENEIGR